MRWSRNGSMYRCRTNWLTLTNKTELPILQSSSDDRRYGSLHITLLPQQPCCDRRVSANHTLNQRAHLPILCAPTVNVPRTSSIRAAIDGPNGSRIFPRHAQCPAVIAPADRVPVRCECDECSRSGCRRYVRETSASDGVRWYRLCRPVARRSNPAPDP